MARFQKAIGILDDLDACWYMRRGVTITFFFISAGTGCYVFFLFSDLTIWGPVSEQTALFITIVAWVLIFPVWIFTFLFLVSLHERIGGDKFRSITRARLSNLKPGSEELHQLHDHLPFENWRNGRIFKNVLADLESGESGSQKVAQ